MMKNTGFWIKTASMFLLRSGRSTAALSLMVTVSVAALVFLFSVATGVNDAMVKNSVSLYSGHISGFGLSAPLEKESIDIKGVKAVLNRRPVAGIFSNGGKVKTALLIGVRPPEEIKHAALWRKNIEGRPPQDNLKEAYLSLDVARALDVSAGDTVAFSVKPGLPPVELKVCGVYKTGVDSLDRDMAFCPEPVLPQSPAPWQTAIFLDDGTDPLRVISALEGKATGGEFKSWGELMPDLSQLIGLNEVSMAVVMALVLGVVAIGIGAAFSIFILRNLREYGIMKAMGVSSLEMMFLIVSEVALMSLAASAVGAALGAVFVYAFSNIGIDLTAFTSHNRYFAVSGVVFPRLTLKALVLPPAASLFFGLGAALWPACVISRKKAAEILRVV